MVPEPDDWRRLTEPRVREEDDEPHDPWAVPVAPRGKAVAHKAIKVVLDDRGAVSDVIVSQRWRVTIRPRDLGQALLDATNKAIAKTVSEQAAQLDLNHPNAQPNVEVREAPSADGDPTSPVAQNLVDEALNLLSHYQRDLAGYAARLRDAATATTRSESRGRYVTVTMSNRNITKIEVNKRWAERARSTEIRAEVLSAFQSAWQQAGPGGDSVPLPPSIARLAELASDPLALCRELGLSR